ncbi:MAG: DNRLRE domain-containing protein [Ardenticatenaceae bacterium]
MIKKLVVFSWRRDFPFLGNSVRRHLFLLGMVWWLVLALGSVLFVGHVYAVPQSVCNSSGPASGAYTVTLCIDTPLDNAILSGVEDVAGSVTTVGSSPGVQRMVFYQGGEYLLTDFEAPYTFELPSDHFVDDTVTLEVEALMRDTFVTDRTVITVTLSNGVTTPPVNNNTFTPYTGTVTAGEPFVLAATGDGVSGRRDAADVSDLIVNRDPGMFLYLGDVYEDGSYTEFFNWYGTEDRFFGRFRDITNPALGDHEYDDEEAPGYFFYWDNVPDFYSLDTAGWHIIILNSNSSFDQFEPGTAQYDWLEQDLSNNSSHCTLAVSHNPVLSVGPKGDTPRMNEIWELMAQEGVDVMLSGDDHSYQRWEPLDGNLDPDPQGITEFVAGAGGQGVQAFVDTDSRMLVGYDTPPMGFGSLFMNLNSDGMAFQYVNIKNEVLDFGIIPCSGAPADTTAPSAPPNLAAPSNPNGEVLLTWDAAIDNTGVLSYTIYRDGVELDTIAGPFLTYTDHTALLDTSYSYTMDAVDAAGNRSPLSNALNLTTSDTRLVTIAPVADSYVNAGSPASNFGNATTLRTDATPDLHSYLRFDVPALVGFVTDAKLRVFANSTSGIGYTVHEVADNSWDEGAINFTNAPPVGAELGASGGFSSNSWSKADLPSLDVQEGALSVALQTSSTSNISYSSREGDNPAELVIELSANPASLFSFPAMADTYVNANSPDSNFGNSPALRNDASPEINSYLRFNVANLEGFIDSATLRVYANSGSGVGFNVHGVSDNSWDELLTTFNNAPVIGSNVGSSGPFSAGVYVDVDVTSLVSAEGLVSFGLSSTTSAAISYSSKEGANPPELLIVTSEEPPTGPEPGTFPFDAVADSYVNGNVPDTNFGTSPLRADLDPQTNSYLRFDVQNLVGVIDSATLRIFPNNGSSIGYEVHGVSDNSWDELAITFNNAPSLGSVVGSSGSFTTTGYIEVDVTSLVTAEGLISFGLSTTSNTAISLASRESVNPPQLVVETVEEQGMPTPTPSPTLPPTATPTPSPTPTPTPDPITITAAVDQDSWLKEQGPNENNGDEDELLVQQKSGDATRAVYRFDLSAIPAGATINQASTHFWVTQENSLAVDIHRITDSWSENGVTWGNTGTDFDPLADGSFTPSSNDQFVSADISALVQEWVDGSVANDGIMLISSGDEEESKYSSREWSTSTERPYLEITYTESEGGASQPLIEINKTLTSANPAAVGQQIEFTIRVTNTGSTAITQLPLQDTYDNAQMIYLNATPASEDNLNDGVINWGDLTSSLGSDLAPQQAFEIVVRFQAAPLTALSALRDTSNVASLTTALSSGMGSFSTPMGIGTDDDNKVPALAVDSQDNAYVVFEDHEDIYYTTNSGGSFSTPIEIGTGKNKTPDIAVDGNGDVSVVFHRDEGGKDIYYTTNSGGSFSSPISVGTDDENKEPAIAVDSNGNRYVVFEDDEDIYYTTNSGGSFSTPIEIGTGKNKTPDIAVDGNADAAVVFHRDEGGKDIYYTTNSGGSFSSPISVGTDDDNKEPAIAVDSNGDAHVVFKDHNEIYYTTNSGGSFSSPIEISDSDKSQLPDIAVDRNGDVHVAFEDDKEIHYTNNHGGSFATPIEISTGDKNKIPAIAVGDDGVFVVFEKDKDIYYTMASGLPGGSRSPVDTCDVALASGALDSSGSVAPDVSEQACVTITDGSNLAAATVAQANWLQEAYPDHNLGYLEEVSVGVKPDNATQALYQFELPPVPEGATVHSATAFFWVTQADDSLVRLHRVTNEWYQGDVTWNNNATHIDSTPVGEFVPMPTNQNQGFVGVDIATLAQRWLDGSLPNYGIMLIGSGKETMYTSKDWYIHDQQPYLQIEWRLPDDTKYIFLPLVVR